MLTQILAYENGELSFEEVVDLFSGLIRSGMISRLQGSYGRTALNLVEQGFLDPTTFEPTGAML